MLKKHLNISYLPYHIDNLINLLNDLDFKFKVITITESRLTTKKRLKKLYYSTRLLYKNTPTKSEKDGVLSYISKELNYQNR